MVIYDLICDANHDFEGWFKNAADFEQQCLSGLVSCPFCDSVEVNKKVAAPHVSRKSNSLGAPREMVVSDMNSDAYEQLQDMLEQVHEFIEDNFEDVGNRFADEAMKIHTGERDDENIRGTASADDLQRLADEGVHAVPLPPKPVDKKKLN